MNSYTRVGAWLERHGWRLDHVKPHGYATTHYWESPRDGKLYNQSMSLIDQRWFNKHGYSWLSGPFPERNEEAAIERIAGDKE